MSQTFHGSGQSRIMDTFVGSICSPLGDRMNLRYSTVSVWNLHFFRLAYSPVVHRQCNTNTSWTWSRWCWCCTACAPQDRSEEHTSELQSHSDLVCRLLLDKKTTTSAPYRTHCANITTPDRERLTRSTPTCRSLTHVISISSA